MRGKKLGLFGKNESSTGIKKLEWSDFDWFHHKKEIFLEDLTIRCKNSKGKSQKILFFFSDLKKHLTLDLSKKMFDIHLTGDIKGRPHENIISIPLRSTNRKIRKNRQAYSKYVKFIPINDNQFRRFIIIDPYSNKLLKNFKNLSDLGYIMPTKLWRLRIKQEDAIKSRRGIFFVYDLLGRRQGIVKVSPRRNGFIFCSEKPIKDISDNLFNKNYLSKKLLELGIKYDPKMVKQWRIWYAVLPILEKIFRIKSFNI